MYHAFMGLTTIYSQEEKDAYVAQVCEGLSSGKTMRMVCSEYAKTDTKYPTPEYIRHWINADLERYSKIFNDALKISFVAILDEMMHIAYDKDGDVICIDEYGKKIIDHEYVQRSRLKIDTWKFYLTKCAPRLYYKETMREQCADLSRRMLEGELDPDIARSMISVLETQSKILRDVELDERIRLIEQKFFGDKNEVKTIT